MWDISQVGILHYKKFGKKRCLTPIIPYFLWMGEDGEKRFPFREISLN